MTISEHLTVSEEKFLGTDVLVLESLKDHSGNYAYEVLQSSPAPIYGIRIRITKKTAKALAESLLAMSKEQ